MENQEITIDLRQLFQVFVKRWWIVVSAVFVFLIIGGLLSVYILSRGYKADTTLYIGKNVEQKTDITYNDMMLGTQLVKDYRELVQSRMISNTVIKELGLKDITSEQLSGKLIVTSKNDTRVIQISTEDNNPQLAMDITNKVADIFKTKVQEIMKVENVQIIDQAELPKTPVRPNKLLYLAISFVLGLVVGVGIIILIEFLDNTIKTPEDVAKYLELPVIGTIPVFPK